jgi:glycosyltransferase involved in cell wall biosynthesis
MCNCGTCVKYLAVNNDYETPMKVTIIIPTLCETARRAQLLRAIASIHAASADPVTILVVVNGQRFEKDLVEQLRARDDVRVIQVAEGSQTNAQLVGRRAVETEFFAFLDDDDEYLPGALDLRVAMLTGNTAALAVTNGYWCSKGVDHLLYSRMSKVAANPLIELFHENWLNNCNHLYRSAIVGVHYFESAPALFEWTWLGFRLTMDGQIVVASDAATFRVNDTPGSLSKSAKFVASRVDLYDRMLGEGPDRETAALIRRRKSSAWHEVSAAEIEAGRKREAMAAHLRSLSCHWSGLRYVAFSRHIFR